MIENKRGLSTIVVTLIIILLSLVAIGIVWVVVRDMISGGGSQLEISSKCMNVDVSATTVNCSNGGGGNKMCDLFFTRTGLGGNDVLGGVKLIFRNATSGVSSSLISINGDIPLLVGKKVTGQDSGVVNAAGVNSVDVSVFFNDEAGNEQLCPQVNTKLF